MRLTIRLLGLDLLDLELTTDQGEDDDDTARDLSGGELGCMALEVGQTDHYLGFGNGREVDDDG